MRSLGFKLFALAIAFAAHAVSIAPAQAGLLINGSFEAVDASAPPYFIRSFSSTPGWTQFGDGVDVYHNNYTQPAPFEVLVDASDGVQFVDMNQLGLLGGIEQVVAASPGVSYHLDLDTYAWVRNGLQDTIGYELYDPRSGSILAQGSYTDNVGGAWITRSLDAVALSSQIGARIQGLALGPLQQAGMGLDNVRLTTAAPEPSSLILLASSLLGLPLIFGRLLRKSGEKGSYSGENGS